LTLGRSGMVPFLTLRGSRGAERGGRNLRSLTMESAPPEARTQKVTSRDKRSMGGHSTRGEGRTGDGRGPSCNQKSETQEFKTFKTKSLHDRQEGQGR